LKSTAATLDRLVNAECVHFLLHRKIDLELDLDLDLEPTLVTTNWDEVIATGLADWSPHAEQVEEAVEEEFGTCWPFLWAISSWRESPRATGTWLLVDEVTTIQPKEPVPRARGRACEGRSRAPARSRGGGKGSGPSRSSKRTGGGGRGGGDPGGGGDSDGAGGDGGDGPPPRRRRDWERIGAIGQWVSIVLTILIAVVSLCFAPADRASERSHVPKVERQPRSSRLGASLAPSFNPGPVRPGRSR
jgi:hypothetical protein